MVSPPVSSLLSGKALGFVVLPMHGTDTQGTGGVKHWPVFSSVRKATVSRERRRRRRTRTRRRRMRGDPSGDTRGEL